ncbi:MAG: hypothetical protein RL336_1740 [Pseudomonadota bacterium]|jgi:flagellar assembly protein FliH
MKKLQNMRIPAEQARAFNALSLPAIEAVNIVEVVRNKPQSNRDWRHTLQRQQQLASNNHIPHEPALSEEQQAHLNELKKAREQASLEGYTEGLELGRKKGEEQGLKEGHAKSKEAYELLANNVADILQSLSQPLQEQQDAVHHALANVAIHIARAVVKRELSVSSEALVTVVEEALAALPSGANLVRIHLHPDDVACLEGLQLPHWQDYQLVSDPQCEKGGCLVKTPQSMVDFSLATRFKQTLMQLFEGYDLKQLDLENSSNDMAADDSDGDPA